MHLAWERRPLLKAALPRGPLLPAASPAEPLIGERIRLTTALGEQPLWDGYQQPGGARDASGVSIPVVQGRFFTELVVRTKPDVVVEFGSAFGVSGMYWLAALEAQGRGWLYTFEVNDVWAAIAETNLEAVGRRFTLARGLFEEHVDRVVQAPIDLAFIDGVHTSAWVEPQFELVVSRLAPGGIVLLDDINFSDDMHACWSRLSKDRRVRSAARANERVGLLQLRG